DIFVSKNYVVTFHKQPVQSISQFRDLLAKKSDTFMTEGSDMLLHTILDRLVDRYLPVIADQERKIDIIEEKIFSENKDNVLPSILKIQKDVIYLKRIIAPQQETVGNLSRSARSFIKPKNMVYFKDIYDHLFRYYQMTEKLHSLLTGILQVYFSHVSTKLNEVIKTMTVIATIGIPPMVIASIYGMNFKHMPELYWEWGYFFSLGLMTLSSAIILIYMKIKKWF
ncbi:MAG TPA: magnesium transporter CorA family protein, partial [Candidatus Omnitrophota bacterium]|nr:magnesium transporter CorA family protein [Candidatus Omnitrophota bacterium]